MLVPYLHASACYAVVLDMVGYGALHGEVKGELPGGSGLCVVQIFDMNPSRSG